MQKISEFCRIFAMAVPQLNAAHAQLHKKLRIDDFFDHLDLLGQACVSQQPLDRIS